MHPGDIFYSLTGYESFYLVSNQAYQSVNLVSNHLFMVISSQFDESSQIQDVVAVPLQDRATTLQLSGFVNDWNALERL
jgi:hypothetical protein